MKTLNLDGNVYTLDRAYLRGARDARAGITYRANPYRPGTDGHDQWSAGHTHETEGLHAGLALPAAA